MAITLIACKKEDFTEVSLAKITLNKSTFELNAFNLTKTVNFHTTHDWSASVTSDWLTIEPMSGSAGDAEFEIKAQPNFNAHSFNNCTAIITISAGNVKKNIMVTQEHFVVTIDNKMTPTYSSTDFSQDGIVQTMQTASVGAGIDIIFMGDGFTDRLIKDGTYHKVMHLAQEALFSIEPYKSFRDSFNCRYVNVVSKDERVANGHDTALGVELDVSDISTVLGINKTTVINYLSQNIDVKSMDNTLVVVIANISERRGCCYMWSQEVFDPNGGGFAVVVQGLCDFKNTLIHECSHGFGKLADEYALYPDSYLPDIDAYYLRAYYPLIGWYKNVDVTNDPFEVKWSKFLSDPRYASDDIGIYKGAYYYGHGAYRPSFDSMMNSSYLGYGFNAPSREAIYYRIHKLAFGDEWQYDYEKFVEYDAKNIGESQRPRSVSYPNYVEISTHQPPIVFNHSWREEIEP